MKRRQIFPILLSIFISLYDSSCSLIFKQQHPTDEKLLENFRNHRAEFDQLLEMFKADKNLTRVAPDFTRPDDPESIGISPNRIGEYRALFQRLNLPAGIETDVEKNQIWFIASTAGLSVSGSGKGYAYLKERPPEVVIDLDDFRPKDGKSFTLFRHLEGDWYLYLEYED